MKYLLQIMKIEQTTAKQYLNINSHELKLFKLHQCDSKLNEQIHFRKKKKYINIKLITYVHMYIYQIK
jgi:hypothetical protein